MAGDELGELVAGNPNYGIELRGPLTGTPSYYERNFGSKDGQVNLPRLVVTYHFPDTATPTLTATPSPTATATRSATPPATATSTRTVTGTAPPTSTSTRTPTAVAPTNTPTRNA